jgi:hypothetical protein
MRGLLFVQGTRDPAIGARAADGAGFTGPNW